MYEHSPPVVVSPRRTRQRAKLAAAATASSSSKDAPVWKAEATASASNLSVNQRTSTWSLPENLTAKLKLKDLTKEDLQLLLKKRRLLEEYQVLVPKDMQRNGLASSVMATLVFAQEEAGTAVCISPSGLLLTCSHCIAETVEEFDESRSHWLLFASGQVVEARPLAWDARRDLALLKIVAAQEPQVFPFITPSNSLPALESRLVCVGHPGSEDLEAAQPGVKTGYGVLHLSTGTFKGYAEGQDPQDNSDIGALMHNCWTYWGHSGAPLIERRAGKLVGMHSSWDDTTGMRRGIALEAIQGLLEENKQHLVNDI